MKVLFLSLLFIVIAQGCKKLGICKDQEFTFQRQENSTNKLRLDGYYYGDFTGLLPQAPEIYMLYQNGIFYNFHSSSIEDAQSGTVNLRDTESRKSHKNSWGVYLMDRDNIEIQYWEPSTSCLPTMKLNGVVLNDSTFKVTSWKRSGKKETHEVDAIFHFKEYSPKPDSVVTFIK